MAEVPIRRDRIFVALTRPQMFAGVTWSVFVLNFILATELFLLFKTFWVIVIALVLHVIAMVLSLDEPRFLDLWITRVSRCPRVRNFKAWECNSYRA